MPAGLTTHKHADCGWECGRSDKTLRKMFPTNISLTTNITMSTRTQYHKPKIHEAHPSPFDTIDIIELEALFLQPEHV
jgi:hypothetical protein